MVTVSTRLEARGLGGLVWASPQVHESHGSVRFHNVNWSHGSVLTVRFQFPVRFRRFGSDIVRTVGTGSSEPKANFDAYVCGLGGAKK